MGNLHYLPLPPGLFSLLTGIFVVLAVLIQIGILRFAYDRLGLRPGTVMLLLLATLVGSYFNIPLVDLPGQQIHAHREVDFFGMRYAVPVVVNWPGTIIAVNVGGAVVPAVVSLYLLIKHASWGLGLVAIACVALVCNKVARPVQGLGIALPVFVPALTAGIVALVLSRRHAASLAYIGGSMGTLVGADLLNLGTIRRMGAPVASIGGAGTFDGIFLAGILAVLIASLSGAREEPAPRRW